MRGRISQYIYLPEEDIDTDNLKKELEKHGFNFEQVALLKNGEIQDYVDEFRNAIDVVLARAEWYHSPQTYWEPEDYEFEFITLPVEFKGKELEGLNFINENALERLEEILFEQAQRDYDPTPYE